MNRLRVCILFFVFAVIAARAEQTNTPAPPASATSIAAPSGVTSNALPATITINGVTYEDVRWGRLTPSTVTIFHRTGVAAISLEKLPPELQKRFGYDPQKAAAYLSAEQEREKAARKAEAETKQPTDLDRVLGTVYYLDARYGFRNLNFEQSIDSCPGMKLVEEDGDSKYYVRVDEDLRLGNAELKTITYGFYKGKLESVRVKVEGSLNSRALLQVLQEAYGVGEPSDEYKDKYFWFGKRVWADYTLYGNTDNSAFYMSSRALASQEKADEKAKAQEGAKGL